MVERTTHVKNDFRYGSYSKYAGETLSYETRGWWSGSPVSFNREYDKEHGVDEWKMSTSSGGQNDVDVLDKIRELQSILSDAESRILETRTIEQEIDGMEIIT